MLSQRGMRWSGGNVTGLGVRLNSDAGHQLRRGSTRLRALVLTGASPCSNISLCMSLAGGLCARPDRTAGASHQHTAGQE